MPESLDALARPFVHASRRFAAEAAIVNRGRAGPEDADNPFHDYIRQTQDRPRLLEDTIAAGLRDAVVRPIGTAPEIAPHVRQLIWLPYQRPSAVARRGDRKSCICHLLLWIREWPGQMMEMPAVLTPTSTWCRGWPEYQRGAEGSTGTVDCCCEHGY